MRLTTIFFFAVSFFFNLEAQKIQLISQEFSPQLEFAQSELNRVLLAANLSSETADIRAFDTKKNQFIFIQNLSTKTNELLKKAGFDLSKKIEKEGFSIQKNNKQTLVLANEPAGLMYGVLELAEQIELKGLQGIAAIDQNPYMKMRGTKFNIPLDARTPSYSDMSDAGQKNIPVMWEFDFWKKYIDELAKNRYNFISLWSEHPFPSLVKLKKYPEIALDDVMRTNGELKEDYSLQGRGFDAPEIIENLEVVKKITMDEKIAFWQKVMRYGKERNVDFYFITWNIFTYGTEGKYGITDEVNNPVTKDYFRKSVEAMLDTYPDLQGIGLTTGENMRGLDFNEKEDWAYDTYALGVLDALAKTPKRKFTFVHRQHFAGAIAIADKFKPLIDHPQVDFIYSFKYAQAHVYSATTQPFHLGFIKDIQSRADLKTIWTLRNDDIYYFRWAAPEFVREFVKNIPYEVSQGYYYGSDQYVWGMNFLDKFAQKPNQLDVQKHWMHWKIWGRLAYNPDVPNATFGQLAEKQFGTSQLWNAWQKASMVYPLTTGFHWGALDFQWYIEACQSRDNLLQTPYRFHDINWFINLPPHPTSGNNSIPDFVAGKKLDLKSPFLVAQELEQNAQEALSQLEKVSFGDNLESIKTAADIRSMAYMGLYYSHKIAAATYLQQFRASGELALQQKAIASLRTGIKYWEMYLQNASTWHKNPLWTNRVGHVDWKKSLLMAYYDLTIIGAPHDGMQASELLKSDKVYEAEKDGILIGKKVKNTYADNIESFTINFEAPKSGYYDISIRYATKSGEGKSLNVSINDAPSESFYCWYTGGQENWTNSSQLYYLGKGQNEVRFSDFGPVMLDQIGIQFSPYNSALISWKNSEK